MLSIIRNGASSGVCGYWSSLYLQVYLMNHWISRTAFAVTAATLLAAPLSALAQAASTGSGQAWPTKQPIKLVAVFPPGGSVDQVARILAVPLSQQLGQNIIVENKGGASGSIGTAAVAAAPADGYTFAVVFDTHGVNPTLIPGLPFDTRKDLALVALIAAVLTGSISPTKAAAR